MALYLIKTRDGRSGVVRARNGAAARDLMADSAAQCERLLEAGPPAVLADLTPPAPADAED